MIKNIIVAMALLVITNSSFGSAQPSKKSSEPQTAATSSITTDLDAQISQIEKQINVEKNTPASKNILAQVNTLRDLLQQRIISRTEKLEKEENTASRQKLQAGLQSDRDQLDEWNEKMDFKVWFDKFSSVVGTDKVSEVKECVDALLSKELQIFKLIDEKNSTLLINLSATAPASSLALIAPHANINHVDAHGYTALCHAIKAGKKDSVQALLAAGASVAIGKDTEKTPLAIALETGNREITLQILGEVIKIGSIILKNNLLLTAFNYIKEKNIPYKNYWTMTITKLSKNITEKELPKLNPSLARSLEAYQKSLTDSVNLPPLKLPATAASQAIEKQQKQELKKAQEHKQKMAQKEKRKEAQKIAQEKARKSEMEAQKKLTAAPLYTAAQQSTLLAVQQVTSVTLTDEEEAEKERERERRKEIAKIKRKARKKGMETPTPPSKQVLSRHGQATFVLAQETTLWPKDAQGKIRKEGYPQPEVPNFTANSNHLPLNLIAQFLFGEKK